MSDFDSLHEDLTEFGKALNRRHDVTVSHLLEQSRQIDKLWDDNAELRDEINALANRLEALTSFVVADPAEVAAKIVTLRQAPDA